MPGPSKPASNMEKIGNTENIEQLLGLLEPKITRVLNDALEGKDISAEDGELLFDANGLEYHGVVMTADQLRRRSVGDVATYVVNRNINFTNVCIKRCGFCAFSRDHREEQGYFLPVEEIIRRTKEARDYGATEVCLQAGLPPQMEGTCTSGSAKPSKKKCRRCTSMASPRKRCCTVRSVAVHHPGIPAGAQGRRCGQSPWHFGGILDQDMRDRISPGRIRVDQWVEVIGTAHDLGIPTTSTVMFGHLETNGHITRHIDLLRNIQKNSGGITEFVPLSFVHTEAPMFMQNLVENVRSVPPAWTC